MTNDDIFDKIKALKLPNDKFVVVGGVVLVALGIRKWNDTIDIDLAVSPDIFDEHVKYGWPQIHEPTKIVLRDDVYDMGVGFGKWDLADLQSDAFIIKGVPFINVKKLLEWKQDAYRSKDIPHLQLLKTYLKTH